MSLATIQKTLARIYTDSKLRDDFLMNPNVVGITLGLNYQEIQQLSNLSSQEVNLFAGSLKYKRLGEIRKFLPLTSKVLKQEFDRLFFRYAETYLPSGNRKHLLDAIEFADFLINLNAAESIQPVWVLDILSYEKIWLEQLRSKSFFLIRRFNYQITPLVNSLQIQESDPVLNLQSNIGIWFRFFLTQSWRSFFIPVLDFPDVVPTKVLSN